jgi:hypothetical protein
MFPSQTIFLSCSASNWMLLAYVFSCVTFIVAISSLWLASLSWPLSFHDWHDSLHGFQEFRCLDHVFLFPFFPFFFFGCGTVTTQFNLQSNNWSNQSIPLMTPKFHILGVCVTYKTGFVFGDRIYWTLLQLVTTFCKSLSSTGHSGFWPHCTNWLIKVNQKGEAQ